MGTNPQYMKIHRNQTMAMQSILLSMTRGYVWHTSGEIKTEKADRLVEKFNERFGVLKSKLSLNRRATRASRKASEEGKQHDRHSATLVIHPVVGGGRMRWVLLATGPLKDEQMVNGALPSSRLIWGKYQICQIPKKEGGITWTWRLTKSNQNELEGWFIKAARSSKKGELKKLFAIARNYPMFSGVRAQLVRAISRGVDIWNRQHPKEQMEAPGKLPVMVRHIAYDNPPMTLGVFQRAARDAALAGFLELSFPTDPAEPEEHAGD